MKTIETVGKDIEQALKAGLEELGCKLDDVEVKILEHPGIFKKARVRMTYGGDDATVEKKTAAGVMRNLEARAKNNDRNNVPGNKYDKNQNRAEFRPKNKQNDYRSDNRTDNRADNRQFRQDRARENAPAQDNAPQAGERKPAVKATVQEQPARKKPEFTRDFRAELGGEKPAQSAKPEFTRDFRTELGGEKPAQPIKEGRKVPEIKREASLTPEQLEAVKDKAVAYLKDVTRLMGAESDCEVAIDGGELNIRLLNESETLIGYRGDGIEALEYLVTVAVNGGEGHSARINLDCGNYRARRDEALAAMANSRADKAVATGRRVELEPMSSAGRKVVHAALAERTDVITRSEGREPNRYIVIMPKGQTRRNGNFNNRGKRNFNKGKNNKGGNA